MDTHIKAKTAAERLVGIALPFRIAYESVVAKWAPDPVPVTIIFSAIGRAFSGYIDQINDSDKSIFWKEVDLLISAGDEEVKNAICTGLIEAVADEVSSGKIGCSCFIEHVGPKARDYWRAWDAFTGCKTFGSPEK